MILGKHHWFHEVVDLHTLLPAEIWVLVFEFTHEEKKKTLQKLYSRGDHQSEEDILTNDRDEQQPYVQSYLHEDLLIQTHYHRIITSTMNDITPRVLGNTIGKIKSLHDQINQATDNNLRQWLKARMQIYKKDLFNSHIISHTFIFAINRDIRDPLHFQGMFIDYVWSNSRGERFDYYQT